MKKYLLLLLVCSSSQLLAQNPIEEVMKADPFFSYYLNNKDTLRIQVFYTEINRNKRNIPSFKEYAFNVQNDLYFYPASTVKMPIALLALEKLNEMKRGLSCADYFF